MLKIGCSKVRKFCDRDNPNYEFNIVTLKGRTQMTGSIRSIGPVMNLVVLRNKKSQQVPSWVSISRSLISVIGAAKVD